MLFDRLLCLSRHKYEIRRCWRSSPHPNPLPKGEGEGEGRLKMQIQLIRLAHGRSGDKGDTANVALISLCDEFYPLLVREVTPARVKEHFKGICKGEGERFELPNHGPLNFLVHESRGGGCTLSLIASA